MTWKVKVSKSNVSLYQLQASVLGINDSESGLWLTPSTMDISQRSPDAMKKRIEMRKKTGRTSIPPGSLSEQVQTGRPTKDMREVMDMETMKMYPTPRTGGGSRPNGKGGKVLEEEVMIEYGLRERGKTLKQMYPTPRASGQEDAETLIKRKGEKAAAQHNLTAHMQMFPTPSASCHMDVVAPPETVKQNSSGWSVTRVGTGTKFGAKLNDVVNKVNQPIKPGGKLNPTFVEFLMGFPENWTKIEQAESKVSATQSSHKWQESSDSQSKKFYRTPTAMDKKEHHQIIDVLTKKQQELVKETKNNILSERTFQALENLFNVIDVEVKRFNQSNMMKSAMENAYNIIQENKRKTNNK
jgi:hypothetical protein